MNVNENDFQKRLDEICQWYETGVVAIYATDDFMMHSKHTTMALDCLRNLRDIAAIAVKQAYQLKEN